MAKETIYASLAIFLPKTSFCGSSFPAFPSRHCFGVTPVTFLKTEMKWDTSLMPQNAATSEIGLSF